MSGDKTIASLLALTASALLACAQAGPAATAATPGTTPAAQSSDAGASSDGARDVVMGGRHLIQSNEYGAHKKATSAPSIGDAAPDFSMALIDGQAFELTNAVEAGDTIVIFYRGFWCPSCNSQLRELQASFEKFRTRNAKVVLISTDDTATSKKFADRLGLEFELASDPEMKIIDIYKVRDPKSPKMALPSIFMVDTKGQVFYRKVGGRMPRSEELLSALDRAPMYCCRESKCAEPACTASP